ncbi:MAG TPA: alpha/beta hydrolase [Stellaceae bacterium]|nr:alpha/beta hydrolase [Stellaceae bacterium]
MPDEDSGITSRMTGRTIIGRSRATVLAAPSPAWRIGPPPHEKGPLVFMNYDQVELDAAYDQASYQPTIQQNTRRLASLSEDMCRRIGPPLRRPYGPSPVEQVDIYRSTRPNAPVFVFIHGGAWRSREAKNYGFAAEMFVAAGAHYVALDFIGIEEAGGDLRLLAEQVRRGIAWVYRNAASFGGDPDQLYVGGHSSGGHLCGVALVTDWQKEHDLSPDFIKGGLCMSGMYDMKPVRLSKRSSYVDFTDEIEDEMSSIRHLDKLHAPVIVTYGTDETPEFQRQARDFVAAVTAIGKAAQLIEAANFAHVEMAESLGNPYGPNGRAALAMMGLATS